MNKSLIEGRDSKLKVANKRKDLLIHVSYQLLTVFHAINFETTLGGGMAIRYSTASQLKTLKSTPTEWKVS